MPRPPLSAFRAGSHRTNRQPRKTNPAASQSGATPCARPIHAPSRGQLRQATPQLERLSGRYRRGARRRLLDLHR